MGDQDLGLFLGRKTDRTRLRTYGWPLRERPLGNRFDEKRIWVRQKKVIFKKEDLYLNYGIPSTNFVTCGDYFKLED